MDEVKNLLSSFSRALESQVPSKQYDTAARNHAAAVLKLPEAAQETILRNTVECLQMLDPAVDSIGYLALLELLLEATTASPAVIDAVVLRDSVIQFLLKFDAVQVRYAGYSFRNLVEKIAALFSPTVAVELLANAILRIDPSGSVFTSIHPILARLAYDANCLEPALKVIDHDIIFYPNSQHSRFTEAKRLCDSDTEPSYFISAMGLADGVKSNVVLEYHLLRGLIYMSRRDWPKAQIALEQVISYPTKDKGVSKIMAESHKKWVLVGLLNEGKAPSFPQSLKGFVKSTYNGINGPYINIASLFVTNDASKLKDEIEKEQKTWEDDGNAALVEEVISAYQKWQVVNLRRVYRQVSISQIRNTTLSARTGGALANEQETLTLVSDMIQSGMLKGELQVGATAEESYVTFHEEYDLMTETEFAEEIARSHRSIVELSKQYRITGERLSANKDYARYLIREQRRLDKDSTDAGIGFDAQIEDEDLMTGVLSHA